jgi:hypothetical protein
MKSNISAVAMGLRAPIGGLLWLVSACSSSSQANPGPGNDAAGVGDTAGGSSSSGGTASSSGSSSGRSSSGASSGGSEADAAGTTADGSADGSLPDAGNDARSSGPDATSSDAPTDAPRDALAVTDAGALVRTGWTAVAVPDHVPANMTNPPSTESLVTGNAFDGMPGTRWATGVYQSTLTFPLTFTVDMKAVTSVSQITLYAGNQDRNDYPGAMDIYFSTDGTNFGTPVVAAHAPTPPASGVDSIPIPAGAPATQFIRLVATRARTPATFWWAIGEMNVYP